MIPLKKAIGCPLIVAAQLNRSSEKEERRPTRSDFRDSGNLEEDAHRIIAVHRIPKQELDQVVFDTELLQLKCRDGGLTSVPCKFHSSHTLFYEEQTPN
jgi:replicative DNA helicase